MKKQKRFWIPFPDWANLKRKLSHVSLGTIRLVWRCLSVTNTLAYKTAVLFGIGTKFR